MSRKVLKRDGSIAEFDSNKLNRWADWASQNCGVSWSDVVLEASRSLPDLVSTNDIQKTLVEVCVNRMDTGHSRMAARLLVGHIYKEAFDDFSIPDIEEFYTNMVTLGFWDDMGYTSDELKQIEEFIDHTLDFSYEYCTIRQFYDKYAISSAGRCLESPQMAIIGAAMSNVQYEENRVQAVKNAYEELSKLKINLPTPSLAGQRTPQSGSPSCCVISGGDSVDSIEAAVHVAYKMTALSSGIGAEICTRSPKDPVKQGTIEHQGKMHYYRYLDRAVKANKQSTRGGSATVTYSVFDPEIDTLLRLKSQRVTQDTRIDSMDYSLAINNLFLKKVAKDEKWMLVSSYHAPKLYELQYDPDVVELEKEYDRVLNDSSVKKFLVPARDIINVFFTQRGDTGRIYKTNLTNINKHAPFKENVRISNLCVAPETQILTTDGYVPISELENEKVTVWNGSEWSDTVVVKTGIAQKLIKVVTASGTTLECTPYHKFYVKDTYKSPPREVRAGDLKTGDKLIKFDLPIIEGEEELPLAYINGFYSGDGCLTSSGARIYLYGEKRALAPLFGDVKWHVQEDQDRMQCHFKNLKDKYFVPCNGYRIESRLKWLAGYADADGCIYRNGSNEQLVITSVEKEFLKQVQLMLQTLGVGAKIRKATSEGRHLLPANDGTGGSKYFHCREAFRLIITSCDLHKLKLLGFATNRLKFEGNLPQRDAKQFDTIEQVIDEGRVDDTFCFNEPKRNLGMFNGILTGQCQEVLLPTSYLKDVESLYSAPPHEEYMSGEAALCFLASLVAGRMPEKNGELCHESYYKTAYEACKFTDNTIEQSTYPFVLVEKTAKARRSIGIGLTDVAHYMARKGLRYDSVEGRNALHRLAELHSYSLHRASVQLAKERGKCEWFDKTKYSDDTPWLPIDTYAKEVDQYHTQPLMCDWEGLRKDIKKYGTRFSVHEAFMPVESSSLFTASTNSLYPIRDKKIFKKSPKGTVYFEAPGIEEFGDNYQSAYSISTKDMLIVYAIFQKFAGQGISADFYQVLTDGSKISMKDQYETLFLSAKLGIKTWYYLNSLTNSVDDKKAVEKEDDNACEACTL